MPFQERHNQISADEWKAKMGRVLGELAKAGKLEIGYQTAQCPNCFRGRLEYGDDGSLICEKCKWDVLKGEYHQEPEA